MQSFKSSGLLHWSSAEAKPVKSKHPGDEQQLLAGINPKLDTPWIKVGFNSSTLAF